MANSILCPCKTCGSTDRYERDGKCKACVQRRIKAYREQHKARLNQYNKEWRAANAEKVKEDDRIRNAKYREENPEKRRATVRAYVLANPEKASAQKKRWKVANPEMVRQHNTTRRARKEAASNGQLPRGAIKRILGLQKWKCACCNVSLRGGYHVDHIEPLAKGGEHSPENLQMLCPQCNLSKSAKDPIEYMQSKGFLL